MFEWIYSRCRLPADQWTEQQIERDHVRDHQHGHVDNRNRVGDAQSRYRAGLPRFGGEGGPVLRGWQTTLGGLGVTLPSERSVHGAAAYCLADGLPSSRRNGTSAVQLECTRDPACYLGRDTVASVSHDTRCLLGFIRPEFWFFSAHEVRRCAGSVARAEDLAAQLLWTVVAIRLLLHRGSAP